MRSGGNPDSRIAAVALDYAARPDRTVIVAPDPADRQELTQLIRADLQAQGRIEAESRALSVLVEQDFCNKKLAANYQPGDEIHFKTGSPSAEGIPNNSAVTVLSIDRDRNGLTVETREGEQVSYNPAQLRRQTAESTIYREETRELAEGDRIAFTAGNRENRVRAGDFATIERIGEDNSISARLDSGRAVELDPEQARHIDYGYTVERVEHLAADRILLIGESGQLAEQQTALTKLSPHTREIAIYTSDGTRPLEQSVGVAKEMVSGHEEFSINTDLTNVPEPILPQIDLEGFGLGL